MRKIIHSLLGLLLAMTAVSVAAEPIAMIVNKANSASSLSSSVISDIYRGRLRNWANGSKIQPVNFPVDSEFRIAFYNKVLGESPTAEFNLPGTPELFKTSIRKSANSVMRFVSRFEKAIGYVPLSAVDDSVKVVYTF